LAHERIQAVLRIFCLAAGVDAIAVVTPIPSPALSATATRMSQQDDLKTAMRKLWKTT